MTWLTADELEALGWTFIHAAREKRKADYDAEVQAFFEQRRAVRRAAYDADSAEIDRRVAATCAAFDALAAELEARRMGEAA